MKSIQNMTEQEIEKEIVDRFKLLREEERSNIIAHLSELVAEQAGAPFARGKGV